METSQFNCSERQSVDRNIPSGLINHSVLLQICNEIQLNTLREVIWPPKVIQNSEHAKQDDNLIIAKEIRWSKNKLLYVN